LKKIYMSNRKARKKIGKNFGGKETRENRENIGRRYRRRLKLGNKEVGFE
jgi:hypothetical protein